LGNGLVWGAQKAVNVQSGAGGGVEIAIGGWLVGGSSLPAGYEKTPLTDKTPAGNFRAQFVGDSVQKKLSEERTENCDNRATKKVGKTAEKGRKRVDSGEKKEAGKSNLLSIS